MMIVVYRLQFLERGFPCQETSTSFLEMETFGLAQEQTVRQYVEMCMDEKGLTTQEICETIDISEATFEQFLTDPFSITYVELLKIIILLGGMLGDATELLALCGVGNLEEPLGLERTKAIYEVANTMPEVTGMEPIDLDKAFEEYDKLFNGQ